MLTFGSFPFGSLRLPSAKPPSATFLKQMERELCRTLAPQKGGRPRHRQIDAAQESLDFALTE